jgi:streptogramin lyase
MLLLPDGTVMMHDNDNGFGSPMNRDRWYRLTPDASGSYVNGTWSQLASMSTQRLAFASDVLPDGRVFVLGGEYSGPSGAKTETNTGEIYNPVTNTWSAVANFPQAQFGDGISKVLPNGTVLTGYIFANATYSYNPWTNAWSTAGSKLNVDTSAEETWVKLPDNSILTYDLEDLIGNNRRAQRYIPSTNTWVATGTVPVELGSNNGYPQDVPEIGPAFALPDGRAFFIGASGNTAYYTPSTNSWTAGPVIPNGLGADDAPGAELPNGHIFFAADHISPQLYTGPTSIFEFDPSTNTYTNVTPSISGLHLTNPATLDTMLVVPTGQVLYNGGANTLAVYTPDGSANAAWKPTITGISANADGSFTLSGTQLNSLSEGASFGDDAQMDSNYPIVQLTDASNHVYYARTYNWSSTGVATGAAPEVTKFKPPAGLNAVTVRVIANGIASDPFTFNLAAATQVSVTASVSSVLPGTPFNITVTAEDAAGHPAAYLGKVHFSSTDPQATLPADYTFTAADHGTHTFSGVVFHTTGSQTITASNGGLGNVTEFTVPTANSQPAEITTGPDGNLWFTEFYSNKIGKITPSGAVTEFPIPTGNSQPVGITAGPDGNLWFTEAAGNKVGKITPAGAITEFPIPTSFTLSPKGITAGPDGNLWFVEQDGNKVGRITPAGAITEFPIPTGNSQPVGITAGSDGNLWFTEGYANKVGKITPGGAVTEFSVPTGGGYPLRITAGSDGNLWFVEANGNKVGRITPAGAITEFPIPTGNSFAYAITAGPDGNLWFVEYSGNKVGRITPAGAITEFPIPTGNSQPGAITAGPDGDLWFTEGNGNKVSRITSRALTGSATVAVPGPATHYVVTTGAANPDVVGTPFTVTVTAQDSHNLTAIGYTGTVHFTSTDPQATLPADYTFTAADNGVHTFSGVILRTPGSHSITATDKVTGTITGSAPVNVVAAAASQFVVSTSAANPDVAGTPFGVTVTARDAYGNTATGYVGTVQFASSDPKATLPADYTFTAADQGTHTFSGVIFRTSGSQTLTASNGGLGAVTEFAIPTGGSQPRAITAGPDGNLWFTETASNKVGRITPAGAVTEFSLPTSGSEPDGITAGPDGNLWFTEGWGNNVGRITPTGVVTEFPISTGIIGLDGITAGPDGNLWFTEYYGNKVGRITPTGAVTEFSLPTSGSEPDGITAGPDGNLWFVEYYNDQVGRITPAGAITEFYAGAISPEGITAGPDGNLWYTEYLGDEVGRITPAGTVTEFSLPTGSSFPNGITAGPDGNLWFTESYNDQVGRITPAGAVTEFPIPTSGSEPAGITAGPDGNLWFTEYYGNQVGRITNATPTGSATVNVVAGAAAQFIVSTSAANPDVAGTPFDVTVTAQDPYGNTATGYTGTVHFSSGDPYGASLPADYTFQAGDQGVHTFAAGATLYTAGTWDITATDTVTYIAGSANVTVIAAPASQFVVSADAASPDIAGTVFDVTVVATDPYGNTDTNYTGTVTFSSRDPYGASLPADYTFQASDQGVATFTGMTALYTAGTWDVTATDTQSGITGSAFVNVQAAPAVALQVVAPASGTSGVPFDVTVIAVDPYGNTDTNYTGTVSFSTSDGDPGVVLPPDYAFQPSDQGQVTFPGGVTLITPGVQTLTATVTVSGITGTATVTVTSGPAPGAGSFGANPAVVLREGPPAPAAASEKPRSSNDPAGASHQSAASTTRSSFPVRAHLVGAPAARAALIDHVWSDAADPLLTGPRMDSLVLNERS